MEGNIPTNPRKRKNHWSTKHKSKSPRKASFNEHSIRAFTMSPEQSQYIWRKTIPHIEVGMGSGVFTSHRSARFVLISD